MAQHSLCMGLGRMCMGVACAWVGLHLGCVCVLGVPVMLVCACGAGAGRIRVSMPMHVPTCANVLKIALWPGLAEGGSLRMLH